MLMEASASVDGPPTKPAKKSLFNRPAGRKALPQVTSTPENLFERSKESFDAILAERQRKHQAKEVREKERQEAARQLELDGVGSRKKRRVSNDMDKDYGGASDSRAGRKRQSPKDARIASPGPSQKSLVPQEEISKAGYVPAEVPKSPAQSTSEIIDLGSGSDSEPDIEITQASKPCPGLIEKSQDNEDEDNESVEEFPELAAAARARARQRELENASLAQGMGRNYLSREYMTSSAGAKKSPSTEAPDPVVQLLITSPIEGSCPLIVKRKLSQRLQEVRAAWCSRQQFPPPITEVDVFLTWRGRRIFDVTSCKSLGIAVDALGTTFIPGQKKGFSDREGFKDDDEDGAVKVHLEAVTEEILELSKKEKAGKKTQAGPATHSSYSGDEAIDPSSRVDQSREADAQVRIILKAKGMADYKIIVKPIVNVARKAFKTAAAQIVFIEFDGERLKEIDMIQDTEISDLDGLDVHIK
ncbi:MAG: hypothetical protein Q9157_001091 [Trypethelium eluteriae]